MLRFHHHKHATHHRHPDGKVFAWLALFIGTGNAAFWTIFPLILADVLGSSMMVGVYYALQCLFQLCASLLSASLFRRFSKIWMTKLILIVAIVSFIGMTLAEHIWHIAGLDIPRGISVVLINISLALFVHDFATRRNLAIMEGRFYLYTNMGWIVGPLIGGYTAYLFGNASAFIVSSIAYACALIYFVHQHMIAKHPHLHHGKHHEGMKEFVRTTGEYFKEKELRKVFLISLGLSYWWAISVVYIPLAVESMGYGQDVVGWVNTLSIVPLVVLEGWVGRRAQKRGVRSYILIGFTILALATTGFTVLMAIPLLLLLAFTLVNIGAAFIEPLRETYFFEVVSKKDSDRFFGIYNASKSLADITGPLLMSAVLMTGFGFMGIWITAALMMASFAFVAWTIQKKY